MSELKVNKVTPATGSQVEIEASTVFIDGTLRAATVNAPAGVALQHNGSTKLATVSGGVTVTGTVTATAFTGSGAGLTGVVGTGVGGSSSAGALTVISDSGDLGTAGFDIVLQTGTTERARVYRSTGDVRFDTNTLCVDAGNNRVGVGTASPATALDVNGTTTTTDLNVTGTLTAPNFSPSTFTATTINATTVSATNVTSSGTVTAAALTASGIANFDGGVLYVNPSTNRVGVNTTAPGQDLDVRGSALVTDGTSGVLLANGGGLAYAGTTGAHPLVVRTNGTERFRVPAAASGIQFPSSPTLSADANTLDAYAEGTHTILNAHFGGNSTAGTYVLSTVAPFSTIVFTRIGNRVMFDLQLAIASVSAAGTGQARITNLPFTAAQEGWTSCYWASLGGSVTATNVRAMWQGTTMFFYYSVAAAATHAILPPTAFVANTQLRASGVVRI